MIPWARKPEPSSWPCTPSSPRASAVPPSPASVFTDPRTRQEDASASRLLSKPQSPTLPAGSTQVPGTRHLSPLLLCVPAPSPLASSCSWPCPAQRSPPSDRTLGRTVRDCTFAVPQSSATPHQRVVLLNTLFTPGLLSCLTRSGGHGLCVSVTLPRLQARRRYSVNVHQMGNVCMPS